MCVWRSAQWLKRAAQLQGTMLAVVDRDNHRVQVRGPGAGAVVLLLTALWRQVLTCGGETACELGGKGFELGRMTLPRGITAAARVRGCALCGPAHACSCVTHCAQSLAVTDNDLSHFGSPRWQVRPRRGRCTLAAMRIRGAA